MVLWPNKPWNNRFDIWFAFSPLTIMFDVEIGWLTPGICASIYIYIYIYMYIGRLLSVSFV